MIDRAFATVLKKLRTAQKMSQEEFGLRAGLHRTYVSQLERGLKSPSLRTLYKISTVLAVDLSEIMRLVEIDMQNVQPD